MNRSVLVTGGCGVLGSAIVYMLREWGIHVVVIDDLQRSSVPLDGTVFVGDFADPELLTRVWIANPGLDTVIHCAAYISPEESTREPELYRVNNVGKTRQLLSWMQNHQIDNFIFASSAAVYGRTLSEHVAEDEAISPISPYAMTKAVIEHDLRSMPLRSIAFRYFNPIGRTLGQNTVLRAAFDAAKNGTPFVINGDNWGTSDGTPVRDFIDVQDLALAHVAAVQMISSFPRGVVPINLGSGYGTPIGRLIRVVEDVTDKRIEIQWGRRRAGDIRGGAANIERARQLLGWKPRVNVIDSVARSWEMYS